MAKLIYAGDHLARRLCRGHPGRQLGFGPYSTATPTASSTTSETPDRHLPLRERRLYDVMVAWETIDDEQPFIKDGRREIWAGRR